MKITLLLAASLGVAGYFSAKGLRRAGQTPALPQSAAGAVSAAPKEENAAVEAPLLAPTAARPSFESVVAAKGTEQTELLAQWLPAADSAEVARMAAALFPKNGPFGGPGGARWHLVAARWVELEPSAAIEFARPSSAKQLAGMSSREDYTVVVPMVPVFTSFISHDQEAALAALTRESGVMLKQLLRQLITWVPAERREAWAAANAHLPEAKLWAARPKAPPSPMAEARAKKYAREQELKTLMEKDLPAARALVDALPLNHERSVLEMDYVKALAAQKSPEEALKWAKDHLKGLGRMQAIALAAGALSKTEPLKALQWLKDNKIGDFREFQIGVTKVEGQGRTSTSWAGGKNDWYREILVAAGKADPVAAMEYLAKSGGVLPRDMSLRNVDHDDTDNNGSVARLVFKNWAASDAAAAAKWLASQAETAGFSELIPTAAAALGRDSGEAGRQLIASLPPGTARSEMVRHAAAEWALTDAPGALQWAADQGGQAALTGAFQTLTKRDAYVASQNFDILPPDAQNAQLRSLTENLAEQKAQAVPEFFKSLTAEQQSGLNLAKVMESYAAHNLEEASTWLNSLPPMEAKDRGISGLVDYLLQGSQPDPEAAAQWAAASLNADARLRRLQRVADGWRARNPNGAADAIRNGSLPADVKTILLQDLTNPAPKSTSR